MRPKLPKLGLSNEKASKKSEDYHGKCEDHRLNNNKTYKLNNRLKSLILLSLW